MKRIKQPRKLLLTILVNLGDVVLFTAAAAAIKKIWPETSLTVMVRKSTCEVVENNPLFDKVIVVDYKTGQSGKRAMLNLAAGLRADGYDMAICFDQKLRSLLYLFLARIPVRIAVNGIFGELPLLRRMLATKIVKTRKNPIRDHGVLHFLDIAAQITGQYCDASVSIGKASPADQQVARKLLAGIPDGKKRVALCVKGTFPLKDWPPERFAELIRRLTEERNTACYIIGAPSDREYAERVIDISGINCYNFCGMTTVVQMAELLKQSDLLVSVCTGTVHVASTTPVPAIVVYGCTVPRRWHPLQEIWLPVWSMRQCSPCTKKPEECPGRYCLDEISADAVFDAATALLQHSCRSIIYE